MKTTKSLAILCLSMVIFSAAVGITVAGGGTGALVEESFDYAAGSTVNGLSGGTGWATNWASNRPPPENGIVSGNIEDYPVLVEAGNKMSFGYGSPAPQASRTWTAITDATNAT